MVAPPASSPRSRLPLPTANHSATMNITKSGWSIRLVGPQTPPQGGAQIVVLGLQHHPPPVLIAFQLGLCRLREGQEVLEVAITGGGGLAGVAQPVLGVLADA